MNGPYIAQAIGLLDKHRAYDTASAGSLEMYLDTGDLEGAFVALLPAVLEITYSDFEFLAEICHGWKQTP